MLLRLRIAALMKAQRMEWLKTSSVVYICSLEVIVDVAFISNVSLTWDCSQSWQGFVL